MCIPVCSRSWGVLVVVFAFLTAGATSLPAQDLFEEDDPFGDFSSEDPFEDGFSDSAGSGTQRVTSSKARTSSRNRQQKKQKRLNRTSHERRLRNLGIYSVDPLSTKELAIMEALREDTSFSFDGEALADALSFIKQEHSIPIVIDKMALDEESLDATSETVSAIELEGIRLENALQLLLKRFNLTYVVVHEVLLITTELEAEEALVTRVYRTPPNWKVTQDQVVAAIQRVASPNSWETVGGPGSIAVVNGGLVISNCQFVHTQVNRLFAKLERLYAKNDVDQ